MARGAHIHLHFRTSPAHPAIHRQTRVSVIDRVLEKHISYIPYHSIQPVEQDAFVATFRRHMTRTPPHASMDSLDAGMAFLLCSWLIESVVKRWLGFGMATLQSSLLSKVQTRDTLHARDDIE